MLDVTPSSRRAARTSSFRKGSTPPPPIDFSHRLDATDKDNALLVGPLQQFCPRSSSNIIVIPVTAYNRPADRCACMCLDVDSPFDFCARVTPRSFLPRLYTHVHKYSANVFLVVVGTGESLHPIMASSLLQAPNPQCFSLNDPQAYPSCAFPSVDGLTLSVVYFEVRSATPCGSAYPLAYADLS